MPSKSQAFFTHESNFGEASFKEVSSLCFMAFLVKLMLPYSHPN